MLLHFHFLLALLLCFVSAFLFFFNFFYDLLVSFFELRFLVSNVFLGLIPSIAFRCIELSFFVCLAMAIPFRSSDHECCHDTSVVSAHADQVVGFSIFVVFQVSSLGCDVVDLLLISFWRSAGRLLPRILSIHRVECCEALQHQPMFHPVTSFVSSVECVFANTCTFRSVTKSQLSNNRYVIFAVCRVWWSDCCSNCGHLLGPAMPHLTASTHTRLDNDNDTLREVPHPSNEGLALQARV